MPPIGSITAYRAPPCSSNEAAGPRRMPCGRLDVVRPCADEVSCAEWDQLIVELGDSAQLELSNVPSRWSSSTQAKFRGAQHVVRASNNWVARPAYQKLYKRLLKKHLLPYLQHTAFGHAGFKQTTLGGAYPMLSRNHHLQGESLRTRSMLWHWDHVGPTQIKVILYLSHVDHNNGCMVAMRHNITGETFKLQGSPFGKISTLPKLWVAELMELGYRPTCLGGPPGTVIIFDPNVVHRGSRPAPGKHRDFVLLLFDV